MSRTTREFELQYCVSRKFFSIPACFKLLTAFSEFTTMAYRTLRGLRRRAGDQAEAPRRARSAKILKLISPLISLPQKVQAGIWRKSPLTMGLVGFRAVRRYSTLKRAKFPMS